MIHILYRQTGCLLSNGATGVPQGQVPVIFIPFSTALSGTRGACVPCQTLMKHDLASTCEIFYIELPLQGCEIRCGFH